MSSLLGVPVLPGPRRQWGDPTGPAQPLPQRLAGWGEHHPLISGLEGTAWGALHGKAGEARLEPAWPAGMLSPSAGLALPPRKRDELGAGRVGGRLDSAFLLCAPIHWPLSSSHMCLWSPWVTGAEWDEVARMGGDLVGSLHRQGTRSPLPALHPARAVPPSTLAAGPCCPASRHPFAGKIVSLETWGSQSSELTVPKGCEGRWEAVCGLSVRFILHLQVPCPPLSPNPCWDLAVLWARCPRMGSAACQPACKVSRVTEQLSLVGSWRGGGGEAALAWFPL